MSAYLLKSLLRQEDKMLDDLFAKLFPKDSAAPSGPVEYIVAGLGNPGTEYENTRHNAGYMALDRLAEKYGVRVNRIRFKSLCGECVIQGKKVLLLKPTTYMNLSGQAVQEALAFYKLPVQRLIVLCDDINLAPGRLRIRRSGSDGGQNGLKNIIYLTGSDAFPRVRIGIGGKSHPNMDLKDWVLGRFSPDEIKLVAPALDHAAAAVELLVQDKIAEAMNLYNRAPQPEQVPDEHQS